MERKEDLEKMLKKDVVEQVLGAERAIEALRDRIRESERVAYRADGELKAEKELSLLRVAAIKRVVEAVTTIMAVDFDEEFLPNEYGSDFVTLKSPEHETPRGLIVLQHISRLLREIP